MAALWKTQARLILLLGGISSCFLLGLYWTVLQPSRNAAAIASLRQPVKDEIQDDFNARGSSRMENEMRKFGRAQNDSVTEDQIQDDSMPEDHPEMKYMRKFGRINGIPTDKEMENMTKKELTYIYHSYLDNIDYICRRKIRMGKIGDGGWEICDDYDFRPMQPCLVYSFGINNDFSFDDGIAHMYKCKVFSFDPSMQQLSHTRNAYVRFLKVGLSGNARALPTGVGNGWEVKTLTDIKAMLGHQNTIIDVLKIDIELSEWPALVDILENNELSRVRQFLIEFHTQRLDTADTYRSRLHLLAQIEAAGFRRFNTHKNPRGRQLIGEYPVLRVAAMEVYFVNTKFMRLRRETGVSKS